MELSEIIKKEWDKLEEEYIDLDPFGWRRNENVKYDYWDGRFDLKTGYHRPKEISKHILP